MTHECSILIVGLGGQGVLLLSRIIATAATSSYKFVCRSESRGLSQRGGSVSTIVRCSSRPLAPTIGEQGADVLLGLDSMEAARNVHMLASEGVIVTEEEFIAPQYLARQWETEVNRDDRYIHLKDELHAILAHYRCQTISIDKEKTESKSASKTNLFMLGAASSYIPVERSLIEGAIISCVKPKDHVLGLMAYRAGVSASHALKGIINPASKTA
jgi:indolepyruvate ferredoxin oxidoreductase, beta subunit